MSVLTAEDRRELEQFAPAVSEAVERIVKRHDSLGAGATMLQASADAISEAGHPEDLLSRASIAWWLEEQAEQARIGRDAL